ncbi:FAD-binding and (Fe-S)-binding domain-containing protein [Egicoccus sp. AB-alg6-2]|uniref:FAD-binding and (Fe-S)-binding domain-containing protein n=1 Tax=Egicoccus sp. AB-alg6-2 TaxID=3242692 RepID=UPI00359D9634
MDAAGRRPDEVAAALRRAGVRDVDTSTRRRAEYSSDASLYRVPPTVVAFPHDADDLAAALEVARSLGVPVTARGAGTSIAGNAIGPGIVLDVRRHMDRVLELDPQARHAVVQPGVVLDDLQRVLALHGLRFGPDPSSHDRCTLGGMIGNNACGSRALGYGRTVDNVVALDVVAGTGERLLATADPSPSSPLAGAALALAQRHGEVIRTELDRFSRQVSGYGLHHLLPERGSDLARALVGSEGTCALTAAAVLALVPEPAVTALVVLGYEDMVAAAEATPGLLGHDAVAIEGMDARIVDVVRSRRGRVPDLPDGGGWLVVELAGESVGDLMSRVPALLADAGARDHRTITDPAEARELWRIREDGAGLVARATPTPSHAGWEDAAVPPARLGAYLGDFDRLLEHHGLKGVPYGHFGDGCVHVRIDFPFHEPRGRAVFRGFLTDAAALVASHGGTVSGEHGDGRARSELLPAMYGPDAIAAFAAFKGLLDPDDLLNPGVLVRPAAVDAELRVAGGHRLTDGLALHYDQDGGDFAAAVHRCTGIGRCTTTHAAPGRVMCPSYLATGDERDSTRGRARVLQEMVDGRLVAGGWSSPEVHDALELCLACKGCASDCPTGVDMGTYKVEVLHQTYRRRLRPRTHYSLGWLPRWARLAARVPRATAWAMGRPRLVRLAKQVAGIDPGRRVPELTTDDLQTWFEARERPPGEGGDVLLWVDTFTRRFAPRVGRAAVEVLESAGLTVRLTGPDQCCGLTWISTGQLATARRLVRRLVDDLAAEIDRSGGALTVLGLEPSCTAVLRQDAMHLLGHDDPAARTVAAATRTLAEVLASRRPAWTPPRLDGVTVVAQPHCHHHAVMGWHADRALLAACGATVEQVGGCCGLAGDFGMTRGRRDVSVRIAESALLPALRTAGRDAVVLADGFSCRTQVADLTGRRSVHLAELLAGGTPG